jgi:hypothetical protein
VLIPCEPLPLFLPLKLSRIYGLDHSEINTSFYILYYRRGVDLHLPKKISLILIRVAGGAGQ